MLHPFEIHRPRSVAEALDARHSLDNSAYVCGGTELLQIMKLGLARFDHLIDLKQVPELCGITQSHDGTLRIGAATTHRQVETSSVVVDQHPPFARMAHRIANRRVRNVGTLGGNLCFAEPHSDPGNLLLAMGATLEVSGPEGRREVVLDDFVVDVLTTALGPEEIVVAINVPPRAEGEYVTYRRIAFHERPSAAVSCRIQLEDAVIREARVVVSCIGPMPQLMANATTALPGIRARDLPDVADKVARTILHDAEAEADLDGNPDYKRSLASVLLRDQLLELARELV